MRASSMISAMRLISVSPATSIVDHIVVDDADAADALHERAVAAGATITQGLRDEDYGSRGFTCRDPEGVYWSFGTYAGE